MTKSEKCSLVVNANASQSEKYLKGLSDMCRVPGYHSPEPRHITLNQCMECIGCCYAAASHVFTIHQKNLNGRNWPRKILTKT